MVVQFKAEIGVFPCKLFSNKTTEIMALFDPQFKTTKELRMTKMDSILKETGYKPLNFTPAGDMSNPWKKLKTGGGWVLLVFNFLVSVAC